MSAASSPQQQAAAKSSRVCLNCRRKKKRCDKALPSCGRCTYSLQVCQHEDDLGLPVGAGALGPIHFESFMSQGGLPVRTYTPVLEQFQLLPSHPNPRWSLLNPSLFASMDSTEDIHSFACRCLPDILGHRQAIEHVVASYFGGVNTWFTILERSTFSTDVEAMWETPSAETAVLLVCMRLIVRAPADNAAVAGMGDSLYLAAKTMLSLVQSKVPLSIPLLQAELIVAMYEYSHSMPQQAYMTVGRCFQITKAFGWHYEPFWSEERQSLAPAHLKLCSILWWAVVYIDCLVHVSYQDQKYPMHTANLHWDFTIPFPESLDQYLPGSSVFGLGQASSAASASSLSLDVDIDSIDGMIWPEATSAWYLSSVLQQLSGTAPPTQTDRNMLSGAITAHTINVMSGNWKRGDRTAAVGTNFIALMKINQPGLLSPNSGTTTPSSTATAIITTTAAPPTDTDRRPVDTIRSVISSIYSSALNSSSAASSDQQQQEPRLRAGAVAPCGAFSMYYASLLLISHGGGVLRDPEWLAKVEGFVGALEALAKRWRIAERYVESIRVALGSRLGVMQM
ncbi:hypothetical protein B0T18DRAFT_390872 [Schizothecium vesticola]|uniref:Zn(2)-C6 fungal-type domain-containing protein n=1 Tax=Schizothecium vesticola TaxID=314040 RepID=A0AA40EVT2_9PEZI|nr:hypothetical protein B0T18DRAFT_390872 [Schizothecium vesticola]